jgi:hypothetical protein
MTGRASSGRSEALVTAILDLFCDSEEDASPCVILLDSFSVFSYTERGGWWTVPHNPPVELWVVPMEETQYLLAACPSCQ